MITPRVAAVFVSPHRHQLHTRTKALVVLHHRKTTLLLRRETEGLKMIIPRRRRQRETETERREINNRNLGDTPHVRTYELGAVAGTTEPPSRRRAPRHVYSTAAALSPPLQQLQARSPPASKPCCSSCVSVAFRVLSSTQSRSKLQS